MVMRPASKLRFRSASLRGSYRSVAGVTMRIRFYTRFGFAVALLFFCLASPVRAQTPVRLNVLYRYVADHTDRLTTIRPDDGADLRFEGQQFYVPGNATSGTMELDRLANPSKTIHIDSTSAVVGYVVQQLLGFPWTDPDSAPGLSPLDEGYNPVTGDYALMRPAEVLHGYAPAPLGVYGYQRYGNSNESVLSLSAGGVSIQSNLVAGGALWRWYWNGVQFVNHHDYGREIQSAFFFNGGASNPTEAGDGLSGPDIAPGMHQGSPVLMAENSDSTQITRAIPLEWNYGRYGGGANHPLIWGDMNLGKDITLNFDNLGPVARYTTHISLPTSIRGVLELPTPYLCGTFSRFWTYDAETNRLSDVTGKVPNGCTAPQTAHYSFAPKFGGVIASDSSGAHAMGEYGVNTSQGGSVDSFAIYRFLCDGDGTSETSYDTVKLDAVKSAVFPAGESTYTTYLMTDTVRNVATHMAQLFQAGAM